MNKKIVIALGGNAILRPKEDGDFNTQYKNVQTSAEFMADIVLKGHKLAITHGNGPQVGAVIIQNEEAKHLIPPLPLFACGAETQGFIGYMIEENLKNALIKKSGKEYKTATLLTQVEVDEKDSAFSSPTKPIGMFYTKEEAEKIESEKGYTMVEDSGRGFRRVVASPKPKNIMGFENINTLLDSGVTVISTGGGGIPVIKDADGVISGIDAVIDKDLSAFLLAKQLDADIFIILTDVSNAYINFGKENQEKLETITVDMAEKYLSEGHFKKGSMYPKVEAAVQYAKLGKTAIICALEDALPAIEGKAGTRIIPNK